MHLKIGRAIAESVPAKATSFYFSAITDRAMSVQLTQELLPHEAIYHDAAGLSPRLR